MFEEKDQYRCKEDGVIIVWAYCRATNEDEKEEGWLEDDILDSPKTPDEWELANLWIGVSTSEMQPASEWDYPEDLCAKCQAKLKEKKPQEV